MELFKTAYLTLWGVAIFGWFMNLFAVFGAHGNELMIRIIGFFVAPEGALMGWFM